MLRSFVDATVAAAMVSWVVIGVQCDPRSPVPAPQLPPGQSVVVSSPQYSESHYVQELAKRFQWDAEVTTSVGTRCDLVSSQYAIEVDWPHNAYEAVGQSLHYSTELGKPPAMLFLVASDSDSDRKFVVDRVGKVARDYGITVLWYDISSGDLLVQPETE